MYVNSIHDIGSPFRMRTIVSPTPTVLTFTAVSVFVFELLKVLFTVIDGMFGGEKMVRGRSYRARKGNTGQSKQTNACTHAPTHTHPRPATASARVHSAFMSGWEDAEEFHLRLS